MLYLKWYLTINQLQNAPWPHPAMPGRGRRVEPALAPEKGGDPRSGEDRRNPPSPPGRQPASQTWLRKPG